jgi:hypothetical protein
MFDLHHTEIIHSGAVDWIKPITSKKHNTWLFGTTERILKNILKNAIIVGNVASSIFTTWYYSAVCCGYKWMTRF